MCQIKQSFFCQKDVSKMYFIQAEIGKLKKLKKVEELRQILSNTSFQNLV